MILIGPPGSGKGTQTERLLGRYQQLSAISSGDLLRDNVKNQTPLGMSLLYLLRPPKLTGSTGIRAESLIRAGDLVPDSMMLRLISHELRTRGWLPPLTQPMTLSSAYLSSTAQDLTSDEFLMDGPALPAHSLTAQTSDDPSASFVLDGFPRTALQAVQLDRLVPVNLVVSLKTPFEVILDRIAGRWIHAPSGRVYNTTFNKPQVEGRDDITGDRLTKRADDDEAIWMSRLKKFQETSEPLLEHYARKGVLWEVEGRTSDEITPKLFQEFEKRFALLD